MKRTALVVDLDGTLVDSLPDLHSALNDVLRELRRPGLAAEQVRRMIGDGSRMLVQQALAATGGVLDLEAAYQRFLQIYQAAPTRLSRLYPGVVETLVRLRESGARLGVCTNKPQIGTRGVLEGFAIADYFDVALGGDAVPFKKPDPRHLLAVIDGLGATPGEAVMIGDNENDYGAARAAGIPVILMRYGYLRMPPESLRPDVWLSAFTDIPEALSHLENGDSASERHPRVHDR
jgi:phosphoglycolate phosphatase